jgi:hypothetical protein
LIDLIKSLICTFEGAWIITGGMNTGIMKLVGEIIQINPDRSRPIHLIVNLFFLNSIIYI